jgi:predicted amidohydrolase
MRLACWQAAAGDEDATQRLDRLATVAGRARDAAADLLVTPELYLTGYCTSARDVTRALDEAGELARKAARIAADTGVALVFGCPEWTERGPCNSSWLVDGTGEVRAVYRKTHLYGPLERSVFVPGEDSIVQARIGGLTVGLLICFDVEFPELARAHATNGTDLLAVPTALARPGEFVAETLVPARAFENTIYVAYANWSGSEADLDYCGRSRVVDPHGGVTTAPAAGEHLVGTDVDPAQIEASRKETAYLASRRPHLYRDLTTAR